MVKKENSGYVGNSLLQTASNTRLGAGRFALLALKGNPKPPVKKVKVPLTQTIVQADGSDERSKISDMTLSIGESTLLSRPALIKEVRVADDIDVESSVLDMSMNSGMNSTEFSLTHVYPFKAGVVSSGPPRKYLPRNPFENIGTSVPTPFQPFSSVTAAYQNRLSNKTATQSFLHPKDATARRSMTLNKGIIFSAPSPMTLNRFEVQLCREHAAPESKEYLEQLALKQKEQRKQLEKQHMRQAKRAVREELKRDFQREQGEGFEAQLEDNFESTARLKKKSLVKKILGKIRPQSPKKKQQKQKLFQSEQPEHHDGAALNKESATAMARRALLASKQKMGLGAGTVDHPIAVASPKNNTSSPITLKATVEGAASAAAALVTTADLEMTSVSVPFPVHEVLMQPKEDSVSDLDASFRQVPVMEIMMGSRDPQSRDDESVSTLGTPRDFQKLDSLLREPNLDPPEVAPVESMPPPPMVLSQDANPLIDQLESIEKSEETATVENRAALCGACFMDPQETLATQRHTGPVISEERFHLLVRNQKAEEEEEQTRGSGSIIGAKVDDIGEEGVEARLEIDLTHSNKDFLLGEKPMFDEVQFSSPQTVISQGGEVNKSAFSMALDQAIREANAQPNGETIAQFPDVHVQAALSPIEEGEEIASPKSARSVDEKKSSNDGKQLEDRIVRFVIDLTHQAEEPAASTTTSLPENFDYLMEMAATRLEIKDDRYAVDNEDDRYSFSNHFENFDPNGRTIRLESPKQVILGRVVNSLSMDDLPIVQGIEVSAAGTRDTPALVSPTTRVATTMHLFDLSRTASSVSTGNFEIYEDDAGEMVICSDDPGKLPKSPRHRFDGQEEQKSPRESFVSGDYPNETLSRTFSDDLFDLLPSGEQSAKKEMTVSGPLEGGGSLDDSHHNAETETRKESAGGWKRDKERNAKKQSQETKSGQLSQVVICSDKPEQQIVGRLVHAISTNDAPLVQGIEVSSVGTRARHTLVTPRIRGGTNLPHYLNRMASSVSTGNFEIFKYDAAEMVVCSDDPDQFPKNTGKSEQESPGESIVSAVGPKETLSGLVDLLPLNERSAKKEKMLSRPSEEMCFHNSAGTDSSKETPLNKRGDGEDPQKWTQETETGKQSQIVVATGNRDVLDHVFEYSEMVFCGRSPNKSAQRMKSTAPETAFGSSKGLRTDTHSSKPGIVIGAGPLFFTEEQGKDTALPPAEIGVSNELTESTTTPVYTLGSNNANEFNPKGSSEMEEMIVVEPDLQVPDQGAEEGKSLLDNDDAYWDTLSTIASTTKDKSSSDSEKYLYETVMPGPIPVEITMANKGIEVKPNIDRMIGQVQRSSIITINDLTEDEPFLTESRTPRSSQNMNRAKSTAPVIGKAELQSFSRPGSTNSGDNEIQLPASHGLNQEEGETGSRNSRVADLIAIFESSGSAESGTISSKDTPGENNSTEGTGLLLAVTRSESGGTLYNTHTEAPSTNESSGLILANARSETGGNYTQRKAPNTREINATQQLERSPASQISKVSQKPCPEMLMDVSKKSNHGMKNCRSVSWGLEEIYEARDHKLQGFQGTLGDNDKLHTIPRLYKKVFQNIPNPGNRLSAVEAAESAASQGLDKQEMSHQILTNHSTNQRKTKPQNHFARTFESSTDLFGSHQDPTDTDDRDPMLKQQFQPIFGDADADNKDPLLKQQFQPTFGDNANSDTSPRLCNDEFQAVNDTGHRVVLSAIAAAAAGRAVSKDADEQEVSHEIQTNPSLALTETEEQNLFARILELSRGLFGSLTPQDLEGADEEIIKSIFSFGMPSTSPVGAVKKDDQMLQDDTNQSPETGRSGNGMSENSPIDVEMLQNASRIVLPETSSTISCHATTPNNQNNESLGDQSFRNSPITNPSNVVRSKLDILREQRTRALERFQLAKPSGTKPRERDRLVKYYSPTHEHLRATVAIQDKSKISLSHHYLGPRFTGELFTYTNSPEERDIEMSSTTSSSSAPSRKARELRRQLDDALKASREIRVSQDQLGYELRSFKSRYYRKNDEIEDHALRAMTRP
jgi:hypothetical protein